MADYLTTLIGKPETEINGIIDTGLFNEIIKGYLVIALQDTGTPRKEIVEALYALEFAFDDTDAAQARKAFREL